MSSTFDLLVLESYEMHIVLTVNLNKMLLAGHHRDSYESYFCHSCSSGNGMIRGVHMQIFDNGMY